MRNLIYLLLIAFLAVIAACSKSMSYYDNELDNAEKLMSDNADSALVILEAIEPSDIKSDSLLAKYHYLKAYSHMKCHRSMTGDSLVAFSYSFYRGRDVVRDIRSGNAFAWYKFWVGDTPGAIAMLDSLAALKNVPDSIMVQTLRTRVLLGNVEYQGQQLIPFAKRLIELESDSLRKIEAGYMLVSAYEYAGETDSALYIIEGLIDYVRSHKLGEKHFLYELELAQLLSEAGCSEESNRVVDDIFAKAGPGNGAADFLHLQYAINALNSGDISRASHYLVLADSLAVSLNGNDALYFRGYSNLIHTIIDFKRSGRITLTHISGLYNRQSERFNRMKA
ncbi:MAG: hypothetical protein J6C81_05685 [Muribaculaceae bacterium]|nr:hypothetical protein [Muribaculaceae bacterium]